MFPITLNNSTTNFEYNHYYISISWDQELCPIALRLSVHALIMSSIRVYAEQQHKNASRYCLRIAAHRKVCLAQLEQQLHGTHTMAVRHILNLLSNVPSVALVATHAHDTLGGTDGCAHTFLYTLTQELRHVFPDTHGEVCTYWCA